MLLSSAEMMMRCSATPLFWQFGGGQVATFTWWFICVAAVSDVGECVGHVFLQQQQRSLSLVIRSLN
jgi:hypothetical protein